MYPLGKDFSILTKHYVGIVSQKLSGIEIERYYYAIMVIGESKDALCQKDLACSIAADNVTMVRIVDYLSKKGFIRRVQNKEDRRSYHLELTGKARRALPRIKKAFDETNAMCLSGFSEKEKKVFRHMLKRMHENIEEQPKLDVKLHFKKIK